MRPRTWLYVFVAAVFALASNPALAQGEGHGHGRGYEKHEERGDEHRDHYYSKHDREAMHGWYEEHYDNLPPGLAKRDRLPPGLEKQLVARGTLPPGLQKKIHPCPQDLERQLPPPPPNCAHVLIGGHVVLLNRTNFQIVDVFHFEL